MRSSTTLQSQAVAPHLAKLSHETSDFRGSQPLHTQANCCKMWVRHKQMQTFSRGRTQKLKSLTWLEPQGLDTEPSAVKYGSSLRSGRSIVQSQIKFIARRFATMPAATGAPFPSLAELQMFLVGRIGSVKHWDRWQVAIYVLPTRCISINWGTLQPSHVGFSSMENHHCWEVDHFGTQPHSATLRRIERGVARTWLRRAGTVQQSFAEW